MIMTSTRTIETPAVTQVASQRLRSIGQRLTMGRTLILDTLADSEVPMNIPMILQKQPGLAQSSVYRNLAVLVQVGVVSKIAVGAEHAFYELSEDVTGEHHHHMICRSCGSVRTLVLPASVERKLDQSHASAADDASFVLQGHRLDLIGLCEGCARR
jgi:Fe2+ or Zn2+ uptake regulation protein